MEPRGLNTKAHAVCKSVVCLESINIVDVLPELNVGALGFNLELLSAVDIDSCC